MWGKTGGLDFGAGQEQCRFWRFQGGVERGCALLLIIGFCHVSVVARGDGPVDTLPWAVTDSDVIVRGVVTKITSTRPTTATLSTVTLRVNETLKGEHAATLTFIAQTAYTHGWPDGERLFFLMRMPRYLRGFTPTAAELPVFTSVPLALRPTASSTHNRMPVVLDEGARFHDMDLRIIKGREAVLRAIRDEVTRGATGARGSVQISVIQDFDPTSGLPIVPVAPAGQVYIVDPVQANILVDERAVERAKRWITWPEPHARWNAVQILGFFESDEHAALLRGALNDPFTTDLVWPWRGFHMTTRDDPFVEMFATWMADPDLRLMKVNDGHGKWAGTLYPIRRDAWDALNRWKRAPVDATIREPAYPPRYLGRYTVPVVVALGLAALLLPFARQGWRHRGDARPQILAGWPGVCLVLLAGVVALWWRSHRRIDDLGAALAGNQRCEVASMSGAVRVIWLQGWPEPSPVEYRSVANDDANRAAWSVSQAIRNAKSGPMNRSAQPTPVQWSFAGFGYQRDAFPVRVWHRSTVYAWTVPLWAVAAVLALPVSARAARVARYRRRERRGLCVACGYDLRHGEGGCPECGRGRAAVGR